MEAPTLLEITEKKGQAMEPCQAFSVVAAKRGEAGGDGCRHFPIVSIWHLDRLSFSHVDRNHVDRNVDIATLVSSTRPAGDARATAAGASHGANAYNGRQRSTGSAPNTRQRSARSWTGRGR